MQTRDAMKHRNKKLRKLISTIRVCIKNARETEASGAFSLLREEAAYRARQLEYILSEIGEKPTE